MDLPYINIFTFNNYETIKESSFEYLFGNGSYTPFIILLYSPLRSVALNGGYNVAIS